MRKRAITCAELNVALVHDWLTVPAGSEAVFEQICGLFPGDVYASQIDAVRMPFLKDLRLHPSFVQKLPFALTKHYLYAPILPSVYARMDLSAYDLVLSDSHSFAHGVRRRADALHINYYHTPARSLWVPEIDDRASKTWVHRLIAHRLRALDLEAAKRPDLLFANSLTTAARVRQFYHRKVDEVIYPPVKTEQWLDVQRNGEGEGLLYWGRLIEYKRVDLAITAARITGVPLNIVGSGPQEQELKSLAHGTGNIQFWGRLSDGELKRLMSEAKALVFPGYEDFGIVPVEALAAGLPVIAFGVGGVTESVKQEHGVLFSEQKAESLAEAIRHFDGNRYDPEVLKNQAKKFDVSRFRQEYARAVERAVEKHFAEK